MTSTRPSASLWAHLFAGLAVIGALCALGVTGTITGGEAVAGILATGGTLLGSGAAIVGAHTAGAAIAAASSSGSRVGATAGPSPATAPAAPPPPAPVASSTSAA